MADVYTERGFTMVETLIALFIMSVAAVSMVIVTGAMKPASDMAYENIAFRIANSKFDELRAEGYANLPASGPFSTPELADLPQGAASVNVTVWNAGMKKVVADVSWRGVDGSTQTVSLTTLIAESGGL